MNERPSPDKDPSQMPLSSLMDGECGALDAEALCRRWQGDADMRRDWHAYQLIGDVLRSDELSHGQGDAAFVTRLRSRLADEPALLAPAPLASPALRGTASRRRTVRRWAAPLGMAAGVALVASAVWVSRPESNVNLFAGAAMVPSTASPAAVGMRVAGNQAQAPHPADVAQFERYLSAHKQFQPTASLDPASGYLRSAIYEANER